MLDIREYEHRISFLVRVQARAKQDEIAGEWEGALKVRLTAVPVDGRANDALCDFLSSVLKISKSAVRILSGERSRGKLVEIRGVSAEQIRSLLIYES